MSFLAGTTTLCAKELRVLARDRQAALLLFGMPAVFVLFLSLALKEVYTEKVGRLLTVVLEVEDDGDIAREIERALRESGDLELVERPHGMDNAELFRAGAARAAVRIPAGFSADSQAFLDTTADTIARRIEWETSPTLDASYRWLLEAQLSVACMAMVQDVLGDSHLELGNELDALGSELTQRTDQLQDMGAKLEAQGAETAALGAELEQRGRDLEDLGAKLERASRAAATAQAELDAIHKILAQPLDAPPKLHPPGYPPPANPTDPPGESPPGVTPVSDARLSDSPSAATPATAEPKSDSQVSDTEPPSVAPAPERMRAPITPPEAGPDTFLEAPTREQSPLPTPLQQTVPGWSLFAMFFIVVPLSHALHRERAEGTVRRILALAVPKSAILAGKLIPYVLVGAVQFAGMLAVGLFVVPLLSDLSLELGRHPEVLVPITFASAFAATSYGLLIATLARTPEQAAAFGATSVVVLAVIGGVMVPHFVMPAFLQKLALVSPLYWGHKAYLDAFLHGATLEDLTTPLAVLTGFALICLALATPRIGKP